MLISQISVFIENRPGRLVEVTELLSQHKVDITALSLADTSEFGILRLIVDQPELAQSTLREGGFAVKTTQVLAVSMEDRPGGLSGVLATIAAAGLSVEYMYAFVGKQDGKAAMVVRASDLEAATKALAQDGRGLVSARGIYNL